MRDWPRELGDLTPAWLTEVLRASGALQDARVESLTQESIGTFSSQLTRLRVSYDRSESAAPATLVLKRPKPGASAQSRDAFASEIRFYRDIAESVEVPAPQLHFAALDETEGHAIMLFEEVVGLEPVDWIAGVTPAHAGLAVAELARLHAHWWQRVEDLEALPHLADAAFRSGIGEAFDRHWRASREYFESTAAEPFVALGDALVGRVPSSLAPLASPATLLHGDAHFENLPLVETAGSLHILFLDWPSARRGHASFDVAVFAVQSFPVAERRRAEESLVADHAGRVRAAGRDWPDPWLDYRRGVLAWVIHMLQHNTFRPGDAPWIVVERFVAAAVDLRVAELVL